MRCEKSSKEVEEDDPVLLDLEAIRQKTRLLIYFGGDYL